ncbi:hypothetical protein PM082_021251 [Marasmius tenuissimus]|nr:hypothetical protein PM082_021251 [Marasmius tenuissimus]
MPSSDTTTSKNPANDEACGVATIQAHLPSPLSHSTPQTAPTATAPSAATVDPSLMTAVPDTTATTAKISGRASVSSTFDDEVLQLIRESETPPTTPGPATRSKGKAKGTAPLTPSSSNAQLADKLLDSGKKQAKPKAETLIKDLEARIVELASNNRTHFLELHERIDRVEGTPTPLADPQFRERLDELERTQSALKSSNNQLVTHVDGLTRRSIEFGNQLEQISGQLAGVGLTQEKLLRLLDSMSADTEERPRKRPNTGETSSTGNSTTTSTATTGTAVATLATPTPASTIIGTPTNASMALNSTPADVNTASSMPQPATQGYVTSATTATSNPLPPAPPPAPAAGPAGYYETSPWYASTIPAAPAPALPPPPAPAPTYPGNNGQYTVRVGPIGLGGSSDYNGVALSLVRLTRRGHRLSHRVRARREGPDTLILSWRTATEARDFYEAWHEGIP